MLTSPSHRPSSVMHHFCIVWPISPQISLKENEFNVLSASHNCRKFCWPTAAVATNPKMRTLSLLFHLFSFPAAITCSQFLVLHEMIIFWLPPPAAADWFVNVIKVLHPRKESMRTLTVSLLLFRFILTGRAGHWHRPKERKRDGE